MFYLGGMTLGYFTPPAKARKENVIRVEMPEKQSRVDCSEAQEREREQELSRAFLTSWHLFY